MKHLIFTLGVRGSVGKTLSLVTIADYLHTRGEKFITVDCDPEIAGRSTAFGHWFGNASVSVDLRAPTFADDVLRACQNAEAPFILADFPPNTFEDFYEWQHSIPSISAFLEAMETTATAVAVTAARPGVDQSARQWVELVQDWASCVVVLNHLDPEETSNSQEEALRFSNTIKGGPFPSFQIPYLARHAMNELIPLGELPSQAIESTALKPAIKLRVKGWITQIHANLENAGLFLPSKDPDGS